MAYFRNENETLYLKVNQYNVARMMSRLAEIVKENGGRVKETTPGYIENRTLRNDQLQVLRNIELFEENPTTDPATLQARAAYIERNAALLNADPDATKTRVTHTSYISFVLNDMYYYFEEDDNPFFPARYGKTRIIDAGDAKKINKDYYLNNIEPENKNYYLDMFWDNDASADEINDAAGRLYDMLTSAEESEIYRETTRRRVHNTYNNGYHYETITTPARYEAITF